MHPPPPNLDLPNPKEKKRPLTRPVETVSGPCSCSLLDVRTVRCVHAVRALCEKLAVFHHGSQGPEFCTLQPLLVHQGCFVLV